MSESFKYHRNNIAADLYRINDDSRACRNCFFKTFKAKIV